MVRCYFDFISPYSYLASCLIRRDYAHLPLDFRPVVLGTIFSKLGVKGPGAIPSRRRIGLQDALMLARHYRVRFEGPPRHPFNSIYALRSVCAVADHRIRAALVHRYFDAAWAEGRALDDLDVLKACLQDVGVAHDPEETATTKQWRTVLKANTAEALEAGAWGVPTFVLDGVAFFGHDRLELLDAFRRGEVPAMDDEVEALLARR